MPYARYREPFSPRKTGSILMELDNQAGAITLRIAPLGFRPLLVNEAGKFPLIGSELTPLFQFLPNLGRDVFALRMSGRHNQGCFAPAIPRRRNPWRVACTARLPAIP